MRIPLLAVEHLTIGFSTPTGQQIVLNDLSFELYPKTTLGLIGESGSGKSVCCLSLIQLLPYNAVILKGKAFLKGHDLLKMELKTLRKIRGHSIGLIFQDPNNSLNPYLTIETQLTEGLMLHKKMPFKIAQLKAIEMLHSVGLTDAEARMKDYPHMFSGGQQHRILIAMTLLLNPDLLIADEPTTALDVTLQLQILHLLKEKQKALNTSMILVTHDMGVAANMCDELLLLQKGHLQEKGPTNTVLKNPQSQYAQTLLSHIPTLHHTSH
jgi:peptide/nickel transport system ATP-binding protein